MAQYDFMNLGHHWIKCMACPIFYFNMIQVSPINTKPVDEERFKSV